jgi:hypothetical protein
MPNAIKHNRPELRNIVIRYFHPSIPQGFLEPRPWFMAVEFFVFQIATVGQFWQITDGVPNGGARVEIV